MTHKDRLSRLGAELTFALCEARNVEVVVLNEGEESSFEEELVEHPPSQGFGRSAVARRAEADDLEITTVFSARRYGARSHKNQKLVEAAKVLSG